MIAAHWELLVETGTNGGSQEAVQAEGRGAEGRFREVTPVVPSGASVLGIHQHRQAEFDPQLSGEIVSLDLAWRG